MDSQDKSATGSVSYDSYARYRGNLNLDLAFGRLTAARDAGHWGPALFHNLVFHQEAVPFHHLVFTTVLGPLRVASLYGSLAIAPRYIDSLNLVDRNVYAHRYELSLGRDILLGISEQMILYDTNVPFLFAPIFPLFIAKGFMYEHSNNSNLAFDAAWRLPGGVLAYGEFLLDDLESPASLFTKDYVQNKWALTLGVHAAREVAGVPVGAVLEWSRVEPWVYAHFEPNTAQAAHLGHPLGNPAGPNSASLTSRFYARSDRWGRVALQFAWLWKGEDAGSGINDDAPGYQLTPKKWLKDVDGPTFSFSPTYSYEWRTLSVYLAAELGSDSQAAAGLRARY